tara:strand:+ start:1080 stop:1751 length:672 start_codon:yes stop_codon:yes gene_type:complete
MIKLNKLSLEVVTKLLGNLTKSDFILIFLLINLVFTIGLAFKTSPAAIDVSSKKCSNDSFVSAISTQLTDVQRGLLAIKTEIKKPQKEINLDAVSNGVNRLSGSVTQLLSNNETRVRDIVNQSANQIHQQIGNLSKQVTSINKAHKGAVYLTAKYLPFNVLSIDSVQEEGVVDVSYLYRTVALETDDVLAGWTLKKVDFLKQKATFENPKHEFVNIQLKRRVG